MKEKKDKAKNIVIYLSIFAFVVAISINSIITQESKKQEIKMQISQYEDEIQINILKMQQGISLICFFQMKRYMYIQDGNKMLG